MRECDFWLSTPAELDRYFRSKERTQRAEMRERATYDYILADAIGRSVARIYSSSAKMPDIAELYPSLFDAEEIEERKQEQQMQLSALRFRQFAAAHNKKYQGGNTSEWKNN